MNCQHELIECSYGSNGYACCEGGPCAADVHNDTVLQQQRNKQLTLAAFDRIAHEANRENREKRAEIERIARNRY